MTVKTNKRMIEQAANAKSGETQRAEYGVLQFPFSIVQECSSSFDFYRWLQAFHQTLNIIQLPARSC
jgi:hypothetical protein